MKKFVNGILCIGMAVMMFGTLKIQTQAAEKDTLLSGIFIEDMSMEGKSVEEARDMVEDYVDGLLSQTIILVSVGGNEVSITPADIGFYWSNQEIVEEAAQIGKRGNIVERYKAEKDLQFENKILKLEFDADQDLIRNILTEQCSVYNVEAENATLTKVDDEFIIHPGTIGTVVDEEASLDRIYDFLTAGWDGQSDVIDLVVVQQEPMGSEEELKKVKDVLGTFTTSFSTSGRDRSANVRNGCSLVNGVTLYPGEEFSTYEAVSPFTQANGYYMAGSYLNGQVVDSLGGGICQVSTTLYNAVLLAELEVTERHNHSMIVTYVDPSADAAIAESSGKDFKFVNNTDAPIYIEGATSDDKKITFTIYGMETRDASHRVEYKSEIVSQTYPDKEVIYVNEAAPIGSVSVQSAHIGYKANLWKIVYENNQEVSREQINSSSYQMVPRYATVGVATADPNAYNEIMAAIATNNIDHVKNVAAALAAAAAPPPGEGAAPVDPATVPAPEAAPAQ